MSLRSRLTLLTAVAFACSLVVMVVFVPRLVRGYLMDRLDEDLAGSADRAGRVLQFEGDPPGGGPARPTGAIAYAELRSLDGHLEDSAFVDEEYDDVSPPKLPNVINESKKPFTVSSVDGDSHWRVEVFTAVRRTDGAEVGYLVVALSTSQVDETTSSVVRIVWIAAGIVLVVLIGAAWLLVGWGLRPLRKMERSAAAITGAPDLSRRVDHPSERTELGKLGTTINGMLSRLQTSFTEQQATQTRLRRFASDASHELRTPLTSIRGYAELYRRGGDSQEQVQRSMERIEHEAERMGHLVEDLLLLARSDEQLPMEEEPVDLRALVEGLVADARVVDPDRPISVDAVPCTVVGDRHRLSQAIANVLANARVHTPTGTPIDVTVRVRPGHPHNGELPPPVSADGTQAVVTIADRGPGLAPDDLDKVFDRFYRTDLSRSRERGGSGLGLAITAAIVRGHGGEVAARPTPGGGATFEIVLPA